MNYKMNLLNTNTFLLIFTLILTSNFSLAEENQLADPNTTTPTTAPPPPPLAPAPASRPIHRPTKNSLDYRLLANYDYVMTNPTDLNSYGANTNWGTTTKAQGSFSNMNGFSLGGGYLLGHGYLGVEYAYAMQDLPETIILPTSNSIQYTFDYQTIYLVYDWAFNLDANQSYEFGGGIGYAIAYQYHWIYKTGSITEEVIWQANPNPIVFKARASYNYHVSENFRIRAGATYEYATSSSLLADTTHSGLIVNGSSVIANQNLKSATGQNVTADISGLRLSLGLVAAF